MAPTDIKDQGGTLEAAEATISQHRVLIFCQMRQMLDIIETELFRALMPTVTYMRLDGTTDPTKRHAIVETFNADPSIDCLLLTTHVGGLGLTLTGADTVIFVEHDWNPMKDLQAMDRAHRLGQKKVVNVYRLITKGTLEEKIMGYVLITCCNRRSFTDDGIHSTAQFATFQAEYCQFRHHTTKFRIGVHGYRPDSRSLQADE